MTLLQEYYKFDQLNRFVPNYFSFEKEFDFNQLAQLTAQVKTKSYHSSEYSIDLVLHGTFRITGLETYPFFQGLLAKLENDFNPSKLKHNLHLYFNLIPGGSSDIHTDPYTVYIYGLKGQTVYRIDGEKFIVNPNDLLRIDPGKIHQAIATDARIALSWGMYDN